MKKINNLACYGCSGPLGKVIGVGIPLCLACTIVAMNSSEFPSHPDLPAHGWSPTVTTTTTITQVMATSTTTTLPSW